MKMEQPTKVMNKEQIIDVAYENYEEWWIPYIHPVDYDRDGIPYYSKEEFIDKCKTDSEFSERWGLKIEERKLSLKERMNLCREKLNDTDDGEILLPSDIEYRMNKEWNIPTKLITITYNNETIESYES